MLKIHDLASLLTQKNSKGITNFEVWLLETEELLKKNNQPQIAQLSVIRAQLMNFIPKNKGGKRKEIYFNASNLLTEAQESLWNTNAMHNQKIETVTELINQLLVIVYQTNAFKFVSNQDFTQFLESIWNFCSTHEQLKSHTTQKTKHYE